MSLRINDYLNTAEDVSLMIDKIESLRELLFRTTGSSLGNIIATNLDQTSAEIVRKFGDENSECSDSQLLNKLVERLTSVKTCRLELAIEPSPKLIERIMMLLKKLYKSDFVLSISLNRRLLGGVVIDFNGQHRDYSLACNLNKLSDQQLLDYFTSYAKH